MTTFVQKDIGSTWVKIADGATWSDVLLQIRGGRTVHVYVGADDPPAANEDGYFTLSEQAYPGASFSPLETENIFVRAGTSLGAIIEGDRAAR
ncbi:hypothetical protein [Martelella sp. HB161492]|uniref:hypothetical protein n=1 Tax=Martelella sp. HB161492 TaxID=2720726 RepID=UPI001592A792|nr:hypothetical protein [Martelella sp. HB161492]